MLEVERAKNREVLALSSIFVDFFDVCCGYQVILTTHLGICVDLWPNQLLCLSIFDFLIKFPAFPAVLFTLSTEISQQFSSTSHSPRFPIDFLRPELLYTIPSSIFIALHRLALGFRGGFCSLHRTFRVVSPRRSKFLKVAQL
jgi:hypothetical protein